MNRIITSLLACMALAGCDSGQTKGWYKEHDAERVQRAKECRNDAALMATADCINATEAQSEVTAFGK